jgi:DNA helicase-2/ATP-dependent DNA helicase PcrA
MSANNHPEYELEKARLDYTVKFAQHYNNRILKEKERIDKEVEYGITHYNSDNAEQFNDLIINTTLQDNMRQKLNNLLRASSKPYFARVDFTEADAKLQHLYVGKMAMLRDEDNEPIVIDWRAPIANLYYEGRLGSASYNCPEGEVKGDITLKRQYTISEGNLEEIYDIDITTSDDFLQAALNSSKDNRLKDIVSTIQAEQNAVIRANMWKPLIVQGAAGGGKTTIALHRIAYLLYNYEKSFSPKNFMILAPNKFFLSYISEVLPELGVENVKQATFEDFAFEIINKKYKLLENHEKISKLIMKHPEEALIIKASKFKASLNFKAVIDKYLNKIEANFLPEEDFAVLDYTIISSSELRRLFLEEYASLPMLKRINEIKKHLTNTLKRKKPEIIESIIFHFDRQLEDIRYEKKDCPERRTLIINTTSERDQLVEKVKKHSQTVIREYLSKISALSPLEYYIDLFNHYEFFENYITKELHEYVSSSTTRNIASGVLETEDLAPLMYIKYLVYGLEDKLSIRHIIIDEAQDYGLFQYYVLKKLLQSSSFTILGDLCQGIHSYRGIEDWNEVAGEIFKEEESSRLILEQSYRTTIEIMDASSSVIGFLSNDNLPKAKPVIRHGEPVKLYSKASLEQIAGSIKEDLSTFMKEGFKSAAVICKSSEECAKLQALLKRLKVSCRVITGNEKDYTGGIVIVPSYLTKGLEFDAVIIANASSEAYTTDELDVKLLYVAMTRALHRLHIYCLKEPSEILKKIN